MTEAEAESIQSRIREQLIIKSLPRSFTIPEMLRILEDVVYLYRSVGINVGPRVRILLSFFMPELNIVLDEEDRISVLYDELASLAAEGKDEEYRQKLGILRNLQEAEAKRMSEYFESQCPLRKDVMDSAIRKADEVLAKHEKPSTPDQTSGYGH